MSVGILVEMWRWQSENQSTPNRQVCKREDLCGEVLGTDCEEIQRQVNVQEAHDVHEEHL